MVDSIVKVYLSNLFNLQNYIVTLIALVILCFYGYSIIYYKTNKKTIVPLFPYGKIKWYIYAFIHSSTVTTLFSYNITETPEPFTLIAIYPVYYLLIVITNSSVLESAVILSTIIGFLHFQENYSSPIYHSLIGGYFINIHNEINKDLSFWKMRKL